MIKSISHFKGRFEINRSKFGDDNNFITVNQILHFHPKAGAMLVRPLSAKLI